MALFLNSSQQKVKSIVEHKYVQGAIIALIIINAITIGLDADGKIHLVLGDYFNHLDNFILLVFVIELVLKLYVYRWSFFKDSWNVFDFIIIVFSLLPESGVFSVVRTLRILRTLRLLKKIPKLRMIIDALIASIPSIGWITVLLGLIFYIFAVIGTSLFGQAYPDWFGSMSKTAYTLFQIMTLESWSMGIARPVMEKFPYAYLFFIPFILVATYTTLNIFIAIVVNAMNKIYELEQSRENEITSSMQKQQFLLNDNFILEQKLEKLEADIQEIKILLQRNSQVS